MDTASEARAIFQFIDKNGDGTLDLVELYDGLSDFGLTDAYIQTIFFDLDTNSDGQVSKEEFLRGYAAFYPHKQGNTSYGADRDGEPPPADAAVLSAEQQGDAPQAVKELVEQLAEQHTDAAPAEKGLAEPSAEERGRGDTDQQLTADEIAGAGGAEQAPIIPQLLCLDVISPLPLQQKKYTGPAIFGKGCECPTDQEVPAPSVEEQEDTDQQLDPNGDAGACGAEQAGVPHDRV